MKRIKKTSRAPNRSPKLPDELHPIVDAVVEIVFERLRSATATAAKGPPLRRKTAKLNLPLPKQRTALAEEIADLLLADLASEARTDKKGSKKKKRTLGARTKAGPKSPSQAKTRATTRRSKRTNRAK